MSVSVLQLRQTNEFDTYSSRHRIQTQRMIMIPKHRPDPLRQWNEMCLIQDGRHQKLLQVALPLLALFPLRLLRFILDAHRVAEETSQGVVAIDNNLLGEVRDAARVGCKMDCGMQPFELGEECLHDKLWQRWTRDERGGKGILWAGNEDDVACTNDGGEGGERLAERSEAGC